MTPVAMILKCTFAFAIAGILAPCPAIADTSAGTDSGHRVNFVDRRYAIVRDYYDAEFRSGRCPPGLARETNGCMAPEQEKKWRVGQPLPRGVTYHEVPRTLVARMGPPPSGHRYVRVADDVLLIAPGTGVVVEAVQDWAGR